jgi:radical SAM protein with 4Fe4S-binding SPASM domain
MKDNATTDLAYPAPKYLLWELTLKCNCRCSHCAAAAGRVRREELSSSEALDVCQQMADLGVGSVCFMGGEALLRPDWDRIALRLKELGISALGLVTNGIALNDTAWRKLEILEFCQLVISLDGTTPSVHDKRRGRKGALAKAQSAIKEMCTRPFFYKNVITSVDKSNLKELPLIRDWLLTNAPGITWIINYASPSPGSRMVVGDAVDKDDFLHLAQFIASNRAEYSGQLEITGTHGMGYFSKRYPDLHNFTWSGCQAGLSTLGLRSDGTVTGCLILSDPFIEGNVRQRSLSEIWNDPKSFIYNRRFSTKMLKGKCRECRWHEACRGGCRDVAYSFNADPFEVPFCLYHMEQEGHISQGHGTK